MKRILLVKATNGFRAVTFPLGLMYLSSAVKKAYPDSETRIIDLRLKDTSFRTLQEALREFKPDAVGIAFLSVELACVPGIVRRVREYSASLPIIVGGPHPSSDPKGTLEAHPEINYAVVGEGEETFNEWVGAMREGTRDFSKIDGLWWRADDGALIGNAPRANIKDIETLPAPDYAGVDLRPYWDEWSMSASNLMRYHRYANLFTSRACPYKCTYCHELFGKGFRARSPEHVVEEMEYLQKTYGVEEFEILDDIFNFNIERSKSICRLMIERGIKASLTFPNGVRTDRLDKELIGLLKQSGTTHMSIAIETATPRLQKQIKKNLKLDYVFEMIEECWKQRIFTRGFFMIGFPSETREEIQQTIDYASRSKLTTAFFFIVVPYKGTALEQENREMVESMNIDYGNIDYWSNQYNMSAVSSEELGRLQKSAIFKFFFNPRRIYFLFRIFPLWKGFLIGFQGIKAIFWRYVAKERTHYREWWKDDRSDSFWSVVKANRVAAEEPAAASK